MQSTYVRVATSISICFNAQVTLLNPFPKEDEAQNRHLSAKRYNINVSGSKEMLAEYRTLSNYTGISVRAGIDPDSRSRERIEDCGMRRRFREARHKSLIRRVIVGTG